MKVCTEKDNKIFFNPVKYFFLFLLFLFVCLFVCLLSVLYSLIFIIIILIIILIKTGILSRNHQSFGPCFGHDCHAWSTRNCCLSFGLSLLLFLSSPLSPSTEPMTTTRRTITSTTTNLSDSLFFFFCFFFTGLHR